MKRKLLLICVALLCAVGSWAYTYTGVEPAAGRTYFLYNVGANAYFVGTSTEYRTDGNIANATPVTVEASGSNFKLAFVNGGTTYRIYHKDGDRGCGNTTGVEFWKTGDANGYKLVSKNTKNNRYMDSGGWFGTSSGDNNTSWQFIACEEAMTYMSTFCAGVAGANYVQSTKGWERVTSISELQTNPEDYFFAIFSANAPKLMVRTQTSDGQGYYISASDPLSSSEYLFGLENYSYSGDSYFVMKAQNTNAYYYPLWDHAYDLFAPSSGKVAADDACRLTFSYSDGAWDIKTWAEYDYGSNWGIWDYGHGYLTEEKMAGNRTDAQKGSFLIYRIAKENLNMTSRIVNPKAETNTDGWTGFDGNVTKRNTGSGFDGKEGFFELCDWGYTWDLTVSQSVNNLPNGYYMVQAAGQLSDRGTTMTLTVNGESRNFEAHGTSSGNILADGTQTYAGGGVAGWRYNSVVAQVTDGTLTITVHGVATEVNRWANFDNVTLTYVGSSLPESLSSVSGKMNADVATAQTNAVNTYESSKTAANLNSALRAIAAAEVSKAAYANAAVYFSNVEALLATTNFYTSAAYSSFYGTYKTAYDEGTLEDATAAGLTYKVASHTPSDQRYTDNTANDLLIPGWTFGGSDATTSGSGFYINTWSTEDNSNGFANPFYEYWVADNSVLGAKKIVGTLSGLTANKYYKVTAKVRVRETNSSTKVSNSITMQVGSGDKVDVTAGTQISTTPRYVGEFSAIGQADGSGNLVLTFDVKSGSNISWLSFRDVNYSDPTPEAKAVLLSTINDANTLYNSGANVGSGVFQIPTAAGTTFSNAIATAQGVYDNAFSTYEEVLSANSTLQTAITTYEGVTLNAPTVGTRYKLTLADRGTLTYQTASTEGGYGMPFKAAGDYMAQTFTFTQVSGNTYTMSFEDFDGNTRYICTRAQYGSGGTGTYGIRSFVLGEDGKTALPITIKATTTANVFNMLNTECDNKKLGSNGGDFYTDNAYTSWSIAEATQAEVTVSCKAGKYGTVIFPFTPDVSEGFVGITFYSCEDINTTTNNVLIESVDEPQANTPYIIKNANGSNFSTILTGWGTSATTEHTAGLLTGVYTNAYIPVSDASNSYYVLQTKDDVQAFYKVEDADFPGTPYKCYLTLPATHVKAFLFPEDPTAINAIETAENENTEIYNLAGQRLSKAQKGVNIVNGKKVLVK